MLKNRLATLLILCLATIAMMAQTLTLNAPSQVVAGQQFQLRYTLNTDDIDDFKMPNADGLEVLYGPSTSRSSSIQMINGKTTQSSSLTLTYVVMASKPGNISIPAATAVVNGKQVKSGTAKIEVLPEDKTTARGNQQGGGRGGSQAGASSMRTQRQGEAITSKDLFIRVSTSKKRVYEQEAILVTYKVYTLVSLSQLAGEMPDLAGCHCQEIDLPTQKSLTMEHVDGRNYGTCVWRQYVVFPQQTGKVTIPAVRFDAVVLQQSRSMDPFDAFFGGGSLTQEVKKAVMAPEVEITVEPLPTPKPEGFSGAVGHFNISTSLTPEELKANDALTMRLIVSGTGNMKLIKTPSIAFPKDFEAYDPKVTDKSKIGREGASGNKIYDYIAVPRHPGEYDIEPVKFCYFDTEKKDYVTLTGDAFHVKVEKGNGTYTAQNTVLREELERLAEDIQFIKRGPTHPIGEDGSWYATMSYWLAYLASLLAFIAIVAIFNKQLKANADIARQRGRRAGKVATKRLKKAAKLMKAHEQSAFYEEVMRALWGYAADRLNMPAAELTKDNVGEKLAGRGVDTSLIEQFNDVLSQCEFARYAPGDANENMNKIYTAAAEVINLL